MHAQIEKLHPALYPEQPPALAVSLRRHQPATSPEPAALDLRRIARCPGVRRSAHAIYRPEARTVQPA